MPQVVVLSEINCVHWLRAHGFKPAEFYTDIDIFRQRSAFFDDVIVVVILTGSCIFSKKKVNELTQILTQRIGRDDTAIDDLIIVSDEILPHCEDYFLYRDNPFNCVRYSGWKATSGLFNLKDIEYEPSDVTQTFLRKEDYGYAETALLKVREVHQEEKDLIKLIKVPQLT